MTKAKLMPCPFCQSTDIYVTLRREWGNPLRITCGNCGTVGPYVVGWSVENEKKVEALWNKRNEETGGIKNDN